MTVGDHLQSLTTFAAPISEAEPVPGNLPPPGDDLRFAEAPIGTLLFLFGGGCGACDEMDAAVARLALAGNNLGVIVMGIQVDAVKPADLKHIGRGFFVRGAANRQGTWLEGVLTVPGLVLVDRSGVVRNVWWGVIDDAQELEIHQVMVSLAGANEHQLTP